VAALGRWDDNGSWGRRRCEWGWRR
jgi:hypothetical protein